MRAHLDDVSRLHLVAQALAEQRMVLVLGDFEQNLQPGGGAFLNADVADWLAVLAQSVRAGRLLITSRYPVPGMDALFRTIGVGPLSPAEVRKLLLRLPALSARDADEIGRMVRMIGGHPRMLEFLDALLKGGAGRLPQVTEKLRQVARDAGLDLSSPIDALDAGLRATILLGSRDVLLEDLLALARARAADEALLQLAVSNLPMTAAGLARALAGSDAASDREGAIRSLCQLEEMSLVHRFADGAVRVHRWTAEGLARQDDVEGHRVRCLRAGMYRMWRVKNESHDSGDAIEAMRNFLTGRYFDEGVTVAQACLEAMRRWQQTLSMAALAVEILESLPEDHEGYARIAGAEAQAHLALGFTERALARYQALLQRYERLAAAEPDRADYQRDLFVSHARIGLMEEDQGAPEDAMRHYRTAEAIIRKLVVLDPANAQWQQDLAWLEERFSASGAGRADS